MCVWADTWLALGSFTVNQTVTFAFYPPTHTDHDACMTVCIHSGAVAAAARELRPVELVGIYEGQKEALEKELAAAKAEVRQGLQHYPPVSLRKPVCITPMHPPRADCA
jgi:hypothetical protein